MQAHTRLRYGCALRQREVRSEIGLARQAGIELEPARRATNPCRRIHACATVVRCALRELRSESATARQAGIEQQRARSATKPGADANTAALRLHGAALRWEVHGESAMARYAGVEYEQARGCNALHAGGIAQCKCNGAAPGHRVGAGKACEESRCRRIVSCATVVCCAPRDLRSASAMARHLGIE